MWYLIVSIPDLSYPLIIRVVLSVLRGSPKKSPALSFNVLIIPILMIVCTIWERADLLALACGV